MTESVRRPSPAHRAARLGQDVTEAILLELKHLGGRVDRSDIVARLDEAIAMLHKLGASGLNEPDHLDLLAQAVKALRLAGETIEGHDISQPSLIMCRRLRAVERTLEQAREVTIDAIVATQDEQLRGRMLASREPVPEPEPFGVSLGSPRLHTMPREPLRAHVDTGPEDFIFEDYEENPEGEHAEDEARDLADEEEDDGGHGAEDPAKRLPLLVSAAERKPMMVSGLDGEIAQLTRLLRTCLEDIGAMGNLRRLEDRERYDWTGMGRFDARLCECLDAAVALGAPFFTSAGPGARFGGIDILEEAVKYGREMITADPGRAFARTMMLASVAGEDTVRAAVLALLQSPPYTYRAQAEALSLAKNPAIVPAMHRLCSDRDGRLVTLALGVMEAHGEAHVGVVAPLLEHPMVEVRMAAVGALAVVPEREAAARMLEELCETEVDDDVFVVAAESLVRLGSGHGLALIRERLIEEVEEGGRGVEMFRADLRTRCMMLLGIAGKADDHLLLERVYFGDPGQALALAFHGHVRLIDRLVVALEGNREGGVFLGFGGRREAAAALRRITGAPLLTPKDEPDPYDVITDYRPWEAWWTEHGPRFETGVRYRFGEPWTALSTVNELTWDRVPHGVRRECARELGLLVAERFEVNQFAARQLEVAARARATIEAAIAGGEHRFAAGRWLAL